MVKPRTLSPLFARRFAFRRILPLLLAVLSLIALNARAVLQFDVFVGYDSVVPEASWFPLMCEIKNDGPSFTGVIEVSPGQFNASQVRRLVVELPTGTLKRIVLPTFSTARYSSTWNIRLLDERGHMRGEQIAGAGTGLVKRQIAAGTPLIGGIPRTATGMPILRATLVNDSDMQPVAARLQTSLVPDNPLVLEGMDTIYLNSERAPDLNDQQVFALLGWLNNGGHLIVGIEQISDINGTPWLRKIIPCDLTDMQTVSAHTELQKWLVAEPASSGATPAPTPAPAPGQPNRLKNKIPVKTRNSGYNPFKDSAEDSAFEKAPLQVATGALRDATVMVQSGNTPLIIASHEGRGRVTALLFSPERKPFSVWNNLPSFWSKLVEIPPELYLQANAGNNNALRGGWSIDGVFGAMIDSKQVRKLPVEWLLLLLIVYLLVIGPIDQYWLKRIKRPMLTWITFPCYVVLFSLLIYFIGYKLRAGETEWNELHLVDVLMNGDHAELRGRTYASIYSPVNATYRVETQQHFSTFRGEFQSSFMGNGGQDTERAEILQAGDNFKADIFVPVWTSQLYVCDWWQSADLPLKVSVTPDGDNWSVAVSNQRDHPLNTARIAIHDRIMELGELPANQTKTFKLPRGQGTALHDFVTMHGSGFQMASQSRQRAFGSTGGGQILDLPTSTMAVSFISNLQNERFISPPGLDMSPLLDQDNAVLLAWEPDYSPIKPLNQFSPRRNRKDTLWRVSVPINAAP